MYWSFKITKIIINLFYIILDIQDSNSTIYVLHKIKSGHLNEIKNVDR